VFVVKLSEEVLNSVVPRLVYNIVPEHVAGLLQLVLANVSGLYY